MHGTNMDKFSKVVNHQISRKSSSGTRIVPCGWTDGQTDMTKLTVAFRNFANSPSEGLKIFGMHYKSNCHVLVKSYAIAFDSSNKACLLDPQVTQFLFVSLFGSPLCLSPYRVPETHLRSSHGRNNTKISEEALNVENISIYSMLCYLVPISHVWIDVTP
jgi:hypothetical protein